MQPHLFIIPMTDCLAYSTKDNAWSQYRLRSQQEADLAAYSEILRLEIDHKYVSIEFII